MNIHNARRYIGDKLIRTASPHRILDPDHGPLIAVAAAFALCALGAGLFQYAFIRVAARVCQSILLELRSRLYRHAQALSLDFHDRYTSGRLISRATTDVQSLRELLDEGLQEQLTALLFDHKDELVAVHPAAEELDQETAGDVAFMDVCPGAQAFYGG